MPVFSFDSCYFLKRLWLFLLSQDMEITANELKDVLNNVVTKREFTTV